MSKGPAIGDWTQYGWIPDDVSSFPARIRLRNAAWMVYYEPDAVVQRERAERLELREQNVELRDENAKLREFIGLKETCWKYVGWCGECPYNGVDDEHDDCNCTVREKVNSLASELGIEV